MRAVKFDSPGPPQVLYVGDCEKPKVTNSQVLIQVAASAINRADTLQRRGLYPVPPGATSILGLEAVGTIVNLGQKVTQWKVGEEVMALLPGGGNGEFVAAEASHVMRRPRNLSLESSAAIPEAWLTAFQLLHLVAGLRYGEMVLIHAGGSGVGTAAVQLVRLAGGRCVVTAGNAQKIDRAIALGAEKGINYKTGDFVEVVKEWTGGNGVDIILDCVGGSYAMKNVDCLAVDGRWLLYGLLGGGSVNGPILSALLRKRGSILASTLRSRTDQYKAELVRRFSQTCLEGFEGESPVLKPIVDSVFDVEDIKDAHQKMEDNKNNGKIVIKF